MSDAPIISRLGARNLSWAALAGLAAGIACAIVLLLYWQAPAAPAAGERVEDITTCIDHYAQKDPQGAAAMPALREAYDFCSKVVATEFLTKEQIIRNAGFADQRYENCVLLIMVVTITISGVVLAGLQLLGSYRLAKDGRAEFGGSGEASVSVHSVAVKSSVVGVVILAISFAFFLVFVVDVYTIRDVGGPAPAAPAAPPPAHQIWNGPMQPLPKTPSATPP
ncbi:MAG TPA: hypothetical protein VJ779_21540 [Acetobacteraceae bacterium]|nr:hypothetical protein [Acetobacteraceae bacterium]